VVIEHPLVYWKHRFDEDWLLGIDNDCYRSIATERYQQLQEKTRSNPNLKLLISEANPADFLGSFIAAASSNCSVFLANPYWVEAEWTQVLETVKPDLSWGRDVFKTPIERSQPTSENRNILQNTIAIPTGGTSGKIRFALHTWKTLMASVFGSIEYFQVETINSCCTLPLYHVSGLMQFLRSLVTGGKLWILPSNNIDRAVNQDFPLRDKPWFISLVPTQLQRILQNPESTQWLSGFQTVLLGGAPAWTELLELARKRGIRLAPTYGMTETASQVATLKPEDFLAGNNSCGRVLPHANIKIDPESSTSENLTGQIRIQASSLSCGYYRETSDNLKSSCQEMITDDLGFFDDRGYLHIVGRCSDKIITGGENVFPAEVEAAIRSSGWVADVCVIGVPHPIWGQAVTAVYVPQSYDATPDRLSVDLEPKLAKLKHPKYWISVESLPRNDRGKIDRKRVREIARSKLQLPPEISTTAKV